jgi:hypothetical protein
MELKEGDFNFETKALAREKVLKEMIVDSYKNRLINEILSTNEPIVHEVIKVPKKSFWKRLFSTF